MATAIPSLLFARNGSCPRWSPIPDKRAMAREARQLTDLDAKLRQMTAVERAGDADHPGKVTAPPSMTRVGLLARKVPQPPERPARARGGPLLSAKFARFENGANQTQHSA
jgi:hypothetical protein